MPLSQAAPRQLVHIREIRCVGYERDDGLWDIEGRLVDTKGYPFASTERGSISAGEAVHDMIVRLTVDDNLTVHAAEAATDSSPYRICGEAAAGFESLKGLRIGPGWRKAVTERMGAVKGCTHLTDLLLGPMPVTAFQTTVGRRRERESSRKPGEKTATLDTCHALRSDGPVVKTRWPDLYTGS